MEKENEKVGDDVTPHTIRLVIASNKQTQLDHLHQELCLPLPILVNNIAFTDFFIESKKEEMKSLCPQTVPMAR